LQEDKLHIKVRNKNINATEATKFLVLASDDTVIESIDDRADVYICHGPSRTKEEIADEKKIVMEKKRKENENMVKCTRFGCKIRFLKGTNPPGCTYHISPPVFHETAKFWSCCPQKKAYDWDDFQNIRGCQSGNCTDVKEEQKQFLGGCDLREKVADAPKLKSIDDYNKAKKDGSLAPVMDRLKEALSELGVENELFDQVIQGLKNEIGDDEEDIDHSVAIMLGGKLKQCFKDIVVERLRIK